MGLAGHETTSAVQPLRLDMGVAAVLLSAWDAFITLQHALYRCFSIQAWWPLLVPHLVSMK